MDRYLLLLLVLLLFILFFGSLSLLRREALSSRFAFETLLVGGLILGAARALQAPPSPILFFVVLYVLGMRARLLVEVANALARRGRLAAASRVYAVAFRLATSRTDRGIVLANQGAALLLAAQLAEAIAVLQQALAPASGLGIKQEAASRCNLGLAYLRRGETGLGRVQLHEVIDLLPGSIYAQRARQALQALDSSASNAV